MRQSAEWRFLGTFWRTDKRLTIVWWAFVALRAVLPAVFAIAMGVLVGAVQAHRSLVAPLTVVGVVFIAMNVLNPVHGAMSSIFGAKVGVWLNDRLLRACLEPKGIAHLERPDLADELSRARDFDAAIVGPPLEAVLPELAGGFSTFLAGFAQAIVLASFRWWAPLLLAGAWLSTHVFLRESALWRIWSADEFTNIKRHSDYAYRLAVESPAAKEMRLFGLARWAVDRFAKLRTQLAETLYNERRLRQRPLRLTLACVVFGNAVVFWTLGAAARSGALPLPRLVTFAQVAVGVGALGFSEFDWWFRGTAQPIPAVLDIGDKLRPAGAIAEGTHRADGMPARTIAFDDVSFTYPTTGVRVLEGFNLEIPAGSSIAIVGPNGAGKTTIAKLLCRLYDPTSGAIRVDGTDLRAIDVDEWRRHLAAVFQDFVRYELSLRENVAPLGASDEVIVGALTNAQAASLADLDRTLSKLYEGGTDLSGGQWQRVALARALCRVAMGSNVVILDEPTAQLDVRGEAEIFDRLLDVTKGRTVVLVSHRFSTVRHADLICVLDGGRVIELGPHDELMRIEGGRYKTMFELQASRFFEDEEGVDVLEDA